MREIAQFDEQGLWSHEGGRFSRFGTLLATAEALINRPPRGYFAEDVARLLDVDRHDALHQLTGKRLVCRQIVVRRYLYAAADRRRQQAQLRARRPVQALPLVVCAGLFEVSVDELKNAILLFSSLLDEQLRRLYAGLEALKLGPSGDRRSGYDERACERVVQYVQHAYFVPNVYLVRIEVLVQNLQMRTTVTLDEDVHHFAAIYAGAKGITLGAAISELIRKAESMPAPVPDIRRSESGLAMFPPSGNVLTSQMVKEAESEFD